MARFLRQSTVATVKLGPLLSPSDGLTPYTTAGFTVKASANGGALAARHDSTSITHDADGYFSVEVDATDTAAVGRLRLEVPGSAGNYLPAWEDFVVLSQAVYDSLFGATALSTYAGGDTAGTGTLLGRLTSTRAGLLDNLDAAVSSRSSYAGTDTPGTATLLSRITAAPPTSSAIATAVRDVDNTSPASGSLGAKVNTAATGGGGTVVVGTGTVIGTPTTQQIQMTSGNLKAETGAYTGRRLYFDDSTAAPFLETSPCVHTYASGTHTFTFAVANTMVPAVDDVAKVIGF